MRGLSRRRDEKHLKLVKAAEEALEQSNYEDAARLMQRAAAYSGLLGDMEKFRMFMGKAGEFYKKAAENLWRSEGKLEASLLYIKAAKCYRDAGHHESAEICNLMVHKYCDAMRRSSPRFEGSALDLKRIGDFLKGRGDLEGAGDCYRWAAEKAEEEGKLALSGGLHRDAGNCRWLLEDIGKTAEEYSRAADKYFEAQEYFEAAWHYNLSGFLLILDGRFKAASEMAWKAGTACIEGKIPVLLDRMSRLCGYLSRGNLHDAEREWSTLRRKMKIDYAQLIERCFRKVRETLKERYPSKYP